MRELVLEILLSGFYATVINILLLGDSKMQCCMFNFFMFKFCICFLYYYDVLFNYLVKINFSNNSVFYLELIPIVLPQSW